MNLYNFKKEETYTHSHNLRCQNKLKMQSHKTTFFKKQILYNGIIIYNNLPDNLKQELSLNSRTFNSKFKSYFHEKSFYSMNEYLDIN